jgi:O-antigen ligase
MIMDSVRATSIPRLPDFDRLFLLGVMLVSGTVMLPQAVYFGGTSGLGVWTTLVAGGIWAMWLARPYFPRELARVLLPLAVFTLFSVLSLAWGGASIKAFQNLSVILAFMGFILVSARECEFNPAFALQLHRALDAASLIAAIAYSITVIKFGPGSAVAIGRQLARWQGGEVRGLYLALWLTTLVFLSESRLAMAASLALFPLLYLLRGDSKSVVKGTVIGAVGVAIFLACIFLSQEMYDRFFGFDASLQVGGVTLNASGRTEMWQMLLESLQGNYLFGKGVASSSILIDNYFPGLGHPHNDMLRLLYDFGIFGVTWWVLFLLAVFAQMLRMLRRSFQVRDGDIALHMTPLLAMSAVTASMFTDNSVSYIFVMAPLGMVMGCSLSRMRRSTAKVAVVVPSFPRRRLRAAEVKAVS